MLFNNGVDFDEKYLK